MIGRGVIWKYNVQEVDHIPPAFISISNYLYIMLKIKKMLKVLIFEMSSHCMSEWKSNKHTFGEFPSTECRDVQCSLLKWNTETAMLHSREVEKCQNFLSYSKHETSCRAHASWASFALKTRSMHHVLWTEPTVFPAVSQSCSISVYCTSEWKDKKKACFLLFILFNCF